MINFTPHHRHNMCDGHFGKGKTKLRKDFGSSTTHITNEFDIMDVFSSLSNTTVELLKEIPKSTYVVSPPHIRKNGIRSWFQMIYSPNTLCYARSGQNSFGIHYTYF